MRLSLTIRRASTTFRRGQSTEGRCRSSVRPYENDLEGPSPVLEEQDSAVPGYWVPAVAEGWPAAGVAREHLPGRAAGLPVRHARGLLLGSRPPAVPAQPVQPQPAQRPHAQPPAARALLAPLLGSAQSAQWCVPQAPTFRSWSDRVADGGRPSRLGTPGPPLRSGGLRDRRSSHRAQLQQRPPQPQQPGPPPMRPLLQVVPLEPQPLAAQMPQ